MHNAFRNVSCELFDLHVKSIMIAIMRPSGPKSILLVQQLSMHECMRYTHAAEASVPGALQPWRAPRFKCPTQHLKSGNKVWPAKAISQSADEHSSTASGFSCGDVARQTARGGRTDRRHHFLDFLPLLAAALAACRPGTDILTPPRQAAMVSVSGTARMASAWAATTPCPRASSSAACIVKNRNAYGKLHLLN